MAIRGQDIKEGISNLAETEVTCTDGFAGGYPCENVNLLSLLDTSALNFAIGSTGGSNDLLNDVWGWADIVSGREFALVGLRRGTAFVEITDPLNPIYLGVLKAHNNGSSSWRDIKTYSHYAYIVSEQSSHGMQIFDLNVLLTASPNTVFSETDHYSGFSNSHNIFINEETKYAYAVGTNTCSGGLHMINLSDQPPVFAGCYSGDGYTHDVQCVTYQGNDVEYQGREICFASNEDTVTIIDVTDKDSPVQIYRFSYSNSAYTHQGWLTEDHNYFLVGDELDEYNSGVKTKSIVVNVMDLSNPVLAGQHYGTTNAIDHNLYIKGDLVYEANYRAGLQVLRMNDISTADMTQVAMFDIYPNSDSANFNGAWSNYPFLPSGNVIVSGIEQGLFVLEVLYQSPTVTPTDPPTLVNEPLPTSSPVSDPGSCVDFKFTLTTDNYGYETSFTLIHDSNEKLRLKGGGYSSGRTFEDSTCLFDGRYAFTIYDSYSNGICCNEGSGSYKVTVGDIIIKQGGTFASSEETFFNVGLPEPTPSPTLSPTCLTSNLECFVGYQCCSDRCRNGFCD